MNEVYISDELHDECISERVKLSKSGSGATLYLAGKRKLNGVITKMIELKKNGGCGYVPGATASELSSVLIRISKQRLQFAAVIRILPYDKGTQWLRSSDVGGDIFESLSNTICITYSPHMTIAEIYEKGAGSGSAMTLNVVSKNFKKKV